MAAIFIAGIVNTIGSCFTGTPPSKEVDNIEKVALTCDEGNFTADDNASKSTPFSETASCNGPLKVTTRSTTGETKEKKCDFGAAVACHKRDVYSTPNGQDVYCEPAKPTKVDCLPSPIQQIDVKCDHSHLFINDSQSMDGLFKETVSCNGSVKITTHNIKGKIEEKKCDSKATITCSTTNVHSKQDEQTISCDPKKPTNVTCIPKPHKSDDVHGIVPMPGGGVIVF